MTDTNPTIIRRRALHALFERFVQADLRDRAPGGPLPAAGEGTATARAAGAGDQAGHSTRFARAIGIDRTLLSHLRRARPISDKVARQIEANVRAQLGWHDVEPGWMDEARESAIITDGERHAMELALAAYRAANSRGKRELLKSLKRLSLLGATPAP